MKPDTIEQIRDMIPAMIPDVKTTNVGFHIITHTCDMSLDDFKNIFDSNDSGYIDMDLTDGWNGDPAVTGFSINSQLLIDKVFSNAGTRTACQVAVANYLLTPYGSTDNTVLTNATISDNLIAGIKFVSADGTAAENSWGEDHVVEVKYGFEQDNTASTAVNEVIKSMCIDLQTNGHNSEINGSIPRDLELEKHVFLEDICRNHQNKIVMYLSIENETLKAATGVSLFGEFQTAGMNTEDRPTFQPHDSSGNPSSTDNITIQLTFRLNSS